MQSITITVNPVNDAPTANGDTATVAEDGSVAIPVVANDTDPDNDTLTIVGNTDAANGTVVCGTTSCTYTPNANFNGTDTFTYTVSDGKGGTSTATVTITVTPANDPPVAVNDGATTQEETPVTISVLANDSDPDADTLTIVGNTNGTKGTVTCTTTTCTYTPGLNQTGTDTFTYTVSDGTTTRTATVTVVIDPVNDPPVAVADNATTPEDTPIAILVLANDTDADGDTLTPVSNTNPANGTVVCSSNGRCVYIPNDGFTGTDSFTYTVSDGTTTRSATVTITVTPVNDPPTAVDDSTSTAEDTPVVINVLANDSDPEGDALQFMITTQPTHGTVVCTAAGVCTYTPDPNFNGTDTFTYTISDGNGGTSTGTVTITVTAINDPPTAIPDSATIAEDTSVTLPVTANDSDPDNDTLTVTGFSQPVNGTVTCTATTCTYTPKTDFVGTDTFTYTISDGNGGSSTTTVTIRVGGVNDPPVAVNDTVTTDEDTAVTVTVVANDSDPDGDSFTIIGFTQPTNGSVTCTPAGVCTYTPKPGFNGTDTFTYTIADAGGLTSTATVTILVIGVNDPPDAVNDSATTPQATPVNISVLTNDTDADGDTLTVTGFTQGANGTVSCTAAGVCTYTPNAGFSGTDSFTYTISDGNGGTDTATVTITVTPVVPANRPPVANPDVVTTNEDTAIVFPVLANDTDPDGDALTIISFTQPAHGTVSCTVTNPCTYTPAPNFNGTDTFTYTVSDGKGGTSTTTVTITVNPVNDPPLAINDVAATTGAGQPITFSVIGNDSDPDGDSLSVVSFTQPAHGTVTCTAAGVCTYTPDPGFTGVDSFTYTISDGNGGTATATAMVTVTPVTPPTTTPPTTTPPTTTPPTSTPTTTPPTTPTTGAPTTSTTARSGALPAGLGRTGVNSEELAGWALGLLAVGFILIAATRRRRPDAS